MPHQISSDSTRRKLSILETAISKLRFEQRRAEAGKRPNNQEITDGDGASLKHSFSVCFTSWQGENP